MRSKRGYVDWFSIMVVSRKQRRMTFSRECIAGSNFKPQYETISCLEDVLFCSPTFAVTYLEKSL